jgi:hypothetical protein
MVLVADMEVGEAGTVGMEGQEVVGRGGIDRGPQYGGLLIGERRGGGLPTMVEGGEATRAVFRGARAGVRSDEV